MRPLIVRSVLTLTLAVSLAFILAFTLAGCVLPNARKTEQLRMGMSRQEVVAVLGRPVSVGADRAGEYLYYRLSETSSLGLSGEPVTFVVRLVDGKVESFTRVFEPKIPSPNPPPPPQ